MKVECLQCETKFDKSNSEIKRSIRHFCSRSCSAAFNNKGKTRNRPKERICKKCNTFYHVTKIHRSYYFCQSCFKGGRQQRNQLIRATTLLQYQQYLSVKGKHPSWLNSHVRGFNRQWNKHLTKLPCANCAYTLHVELAHRKGIATFPLTTTLGEINAESNNIQLCRRCHWEFDKGLLQL